MKDMLQHVEKKRDTVWQRCMAQAAIMCDQSLQPVCGNLLARMYRPIQLVVFRAITRRPRRR